MRRAIGEIVRQQATTGIDVDRRRRAQQGQLDGLCAGAPERARGDRQPAALSRARRATRSPSRAPTRTCSVMLAARSGAIVAKRTVRPRAQVCTGPIAYVGQEELAADIANLKARLQGVAAEEAFMTAISPSNLELYYENRHYASRRGVSRGARRGDARRIQGDRRCGLAAADRRSAHGDALQSRGRCLDRGLPQVHRAARRGGEPCAARHSAGARALPHLLQRQHRAARARFRAAGTSST